MQDAVSAPIACTLGEEALGQRLEWIRRVTDGSLLGHELNGTTLHLTYRADVLEDLEQIVAKERECCSFLAYSLERVDDTVRLTIEAPQGVGSDARWLFDQFMPTAKSLVAKSCGCKPGACS